MLERLQALEENIASLERFKFEHSLVEVEGTKSLQWALRYGLIESIQIVIDTACHICTSRNLGTPKNYGDCIRLIAQFGYLKRGLADELLSVIGLRNLLIHEYIHLDTARLYTFLESLDIFRSYASAVKDVLS
ncbi:MAG: DUF86 domain-containing protein [Spirochaetes bacterium]|nr:DUF86 domain-containing protein [Spirochaetota bacterium]